ncbi:hypothetical protein [Paraflavitalea speifideaquila]|uniref:hypothetical protein n=1 Tax=Paraflavitalea speifideaquila TaxID=3076558 RepID=UPI003CCD47C9
MKILYRNILDVHLLHHGNGLFQIEFGKGVSGYTGDDGLSFLGAAAWLASGKVNVPARPKAVCCKKFRLDVIWLVYTIGCNEHGRYNM